MHQYRLNGKLTLDDISTCRLTLQTSVIQYSHHHHHRHHHQLSPKAVETASVCVRHACPEKSGLYVELSLITFTSFYLHQEGHAFLLGFWPVHPVCEQDHDQGQRQRHSP